MTALTKYSFRILALSSVLFIAVNYGNLSYPLYLSVPLCLLPWMIYDIFLPAHIASGRYTGFILESISILSALVLLDLYFFSIFFLVLIFQSAYMFSRRISLIIVASFSVVLVVVNTVPDRSPGALIILIPVTLIALVLFRAGKERESELVSEIEAQQKQIDGKNKLLSTLAHELRTPLAVIKTSTEIMQEGRPGEINSTQRRFLKAILDNTLRMVSFVDTILASIKVEYAWFRMNRKPMDIRTVIKKVCSDLHPLIQSRDQELKYSYPNLLSRTIADENWIQQVLINLIHNASKHVVRNGRIIISVTENEQCIVVSVSDDGSGIENQEKPMIFSEFYQGSEAEDENMDGVGLGLSIVKNVIEKHNGKVYVGSVAGLGTTLSFTLPKEGDEGCSMKF
jgi:signal transduction histidine kinase